VLELYAAGRPDALHRRNKSIVKATALKEPLIEAGDVASWSFERLSDRHAAIGGSWVRIASHLFGELAGCHPNQPPEDAVEVAWVVIADLIADLRRIHRMGA